MGSNTQTIGSSQTTGTTAQDNTGINATPPYPNLSQNGFAFLAANTAIGTGMTTVIVLSIPSAGRYQVFGQLTLSGATTAGAVALQIAGITAASMWIPDNHPYTLGVEGLYTFAAPNVLWLQLGSDGVLAGANALRLDPVKGIIGATYLGYTRIS